MFARRSGDQFSGPKTKPILGLANEARNGFRLRATNQAGAVKSYKSSRRSFGLFWSLIILSFVLATL